MLDDKRIGIINVLIYYSDLVAKINSSLGLILSCAALAIKLGKEYDLAMEIHKIVMEYDNRKNEHLYN